MKQTILVLAVAIAISVPSAIPQSTAVGSQRNLAAVKLKDILEKGLRAYKPTDFTYIAKVVAAVDTGQLSRRFVLGTFHYTRRKYKFKKYLVPYFQAVLTKRAAKIGVTI